jgi:hypothetical protein
VAVRSVVVCSFYELWKLNAGIIELVNQDKNIKLVKLVQTTSNYYYVDFLTNNAILENDELSERHSTTETIVANGTDQEWNKKVSSGKFDKNSTSLLFE